MEKTQTPKFKKQQLPSNESYFKNYYEANKAKWTEYNERQKNNYLDCEICQCSVQYSHKNFHFKTKKHIRNMELKTQKQEK